MRLDDTWSRPGALFGIALVVFGLSACAGPLERRAGAAPRLPAEPPRIATASASGQPSDAASFDGSLEGAVRLALAQSPSIAAAYEDWRASVQRIAQARKLPEPVLTYGLFLQSVETRVGPQRHRFNLSQAFPWPTKLGASADSASLAAEGAARGVEAEALTVKRKVTEAYTRLWLVARVREVQTAEREVLQQLASIVRVRLETGQATLADLAQIDLSVSRRGDAVASLDAEESKAGAALLAAIGVESGRLPPLKASVPPTIVPAESDDALRDAVASSPRARAMAKMAEARDKRAESAAADRYPGFVLGLDYIETGPTKMPGVEDSGKDAVVATLSVKLPIWAGAYDAAEGEARAEGAAFRAREAAIRVELAGEAVATAARVRDAARRVRLHETTLLPQAETVYESLLGSYVAGRATPAQLLMAEREMLDLSLSLLQMRAEGAIAWARLEELVGRPVAAKELP